MKSISGISGGLLMVLFGLLVIISCDKTSEEPVSVDVLQEVAAAVGLDFLHFSGATGEYFIPEMIGAGVALLDYDRDGDLDIYLLQGGPLGEHTPALDVRRSPSNEPLLGNRLFRNELIPAKQLSFSDVTQEAGLGYQGYGMGVAVGDFDNDGFQDLYVTNFGANVLYRNNGDGHFIDVTDIAGVDDGRWSTSAAFLDYDRDGDLDLFVTNYLDFTVKGNKRCFFKTGQRDYCGPMSYEPVPDKLFRNDGDGRFADVGQLAGLGSAFGSGLGITAADFNQDGWLDIYVANDARANQLWINQKNGTFAETALMSGTAYNEQGKAEASMGVTAGDFDGDGDADLFMTHLDGETNTLYRNNGAGNFYDVTNKFKLAHVSLPYTGFGSEWFDYDNDGDLDLFVANGAVKLASGLTAQSLSYQQTNQLFENKMAASFADISLHSGAAMQLMEVSRGAAFGDIDNDGDIDIVVTNNNGPVRLLRNDVGNSRHWLSIQLEGVQSNRDGLGALVGILRAGLPPLWRRAHTDGSYLSANDVRVHFGLDVATQVDGVVVRWPTGSTEVWRHIAVDTIIKIREGSGASYDAKN